MALHLITANFHPNPFSFLRKKCNFLDLWQNGLTKGVKRVADRRCRSAARTSAWTPDAGDARPSLIAPIIDPDDSESSSYFVNLYGPFVHAIGRSRGLQDADACGLLQDVMREVSRSVSRSELDPGQRRFRGWLGVITRRMPARFEARRPHRADSCRLLQRASAASRDRESDVVFSAATYVACRPVKPIARAGRLQA